MKKYHIEKIVSGGQTGVDRAALDFAMEYGIPCGGWCPKGRRAEDGMIPEKYPLKETDTEDYVRRTEMNVCDSDATLIIIPGRPTGGTALTIKYARENGKPFEIIDPCKKDAVERFFRWFDLRKIAILNVAGPRESNMPGIYGKSLDFLRKVAVRLV